MIKSERNFVYSITEEVQVQKDYEGLLLIPKQKWFVASISH